MSAAPVSTRRPVGHGGTRYFTRVLRVVAGTEFKLKYGDSALGYVWSVLKPLGLFAILYVVFGRFFKLEFNFQHFPLYLLIGLVLWLYFIDAATLAMYSVVTRGSLLRKLAFPRLIIPISATLTAAITFVVNTAVIIVFIAFNEIVPRWEWLAHFPLLVKLYVFSLVLGLLLAALFVRFRDTAQVWELVSSILFYAAPIIYPVFFLPPWSKEWAFLSPFVQIIQDVRTIILGPHEVTPIDTAADIYGTSAGRLLPVGVAVLTFVIGYAVFRREAPRFAERV